MWVGIKYAIAARKKLKIKMVSASCTSPGSVKATRVMRRVAKVRACMRVCVCELIKNGRAAKAETVCALY